MDTLRIECVGSGVLDIDKLTPFQGSLKTLSKDNYLKLKTEMLAEGFSFPVFIWQHDNSNFLIDGHQRLSTLKKMREEGYKIPEIPVALVKAPTYKAAKQKVLAAASVYGRIDADGFYEFLHNAGLDLDEVVEKIDLPNFNLDEFKAGYSPEGQGGGSGDPDEVPEPPKVAKTKLGDLYKLGQHRLLCGDSTKKEDVERLMGGEKADMVFTDPPYGVDYEGVNNDHLKAEALRDFVRSALALADASMRPGACYYVFHPDIHAYEFIGAVRDVGWTQARPASLLWVKDSLVLGRGDYHSRSEPMLYGWKPGAGHRQLKDRSQDNVWEYPKPKSAEGHPTMKPVELVARAVQNSSGPGDLVYEPFCGGGSTLIACEKTNRKCYGMELDPIYCDVIISRWEQFTGKKAELIK